MNVATRTSLLIVICLLWAGPAHAQGAWKQLAAAADAQAERAGTISLRFGWDIPDKRLLMLARQSEDRLVLYQIDHKTGLPPSSVAKHVDCHFAKSALYCIAPGETAASLVAGRDTDLWTALQDHALAQIARLDARSNESVQAQLSALRAPLEMDVHRQRHPFEWGGEHETIENAQAFLEAATARGLRFRSMSPAPPPLGSEGSSWKNQEDRITLTTTGRCTMLARSAPRIAIHYNRGARRDAAVENEATYRWQQPVDWRHVESIQLDHDSVFFYGTYAGTFQGAGLEYLGGWHPATLSTDAVRSDPSMYSIRTWNIDLMPSDAGLRERVMYAATYLDIMCGEA